jgi:hypothetical protein
MMESYREPVAKNITWDEIHHIRFIFNEKNHGESKKLDK